MATTMAKKATVLSATFESHVLLSSHMFLGAARGSSSLRWAPALCLIHGAHIATILFVSYQPLLVSLVKPCGFRSLNGDAWTWTQMPSNWSSPEIQFQTQPRTQPAEENDEHPVVFLDYIRIQLLFCFHSAIDRNPLPCQGPRFWLQILMGRCLNSTGARS